MTKTGYDALVAGMGAEFAARRGANDNVVATGPEPGTVRSATGEHEQPPSTPST